MVSPIVWICGRPVLRSDRNQVAFKGNFTIMDPVIKHYMLYIEKISSGDISCHIPQISRLWIYDRYNFGYPQLKSLCINRAFPGDQHGYFALIASVFITEIIPQVLFFKEGSDVDPGGP